MAAPYPCFCPTQQLEEGLKPCRNGQHMHTEITEHSCSPKQMKHCLFFIEEGQELVEELRSGAWRKGCSPAALQGALNEPPALITHSPSSWRSLGFCRHGLHQQAQKHVGHPVLGPVSRCLGSTAPLSCWPRRRSSSDLRLSPVPVLTASPLKCLATCHPWHARRQGGHILFTLPAPQKARGCPGDVSGHPP